MKRAVIFLIILTLPMLLHAEAEEAQDAIDALLETIDLTEWDAWFRENGPDGMLPSDILKHLAKMQTIGDPGSLQKDLFSIMKPSIKAAAANTALLLGLAAFGAALQGISGSSSIGETAGAVFRYSAAAAILVVLLAEIRAAYSALSGIGSLSELLLPVIIGYLTLSGFENTALLLPASYALLSDVVLRMIETCIAPMAVIGGVILVFDANGRGRLASVGRLLQRASKWILATACSLYMAVTAVRSAAAKGADSLLIKTARLAARSIPAVGSLLSESVDTAFQCMRLVKNILGLTGCIVLLSVALKPVISVFLTRSSFRASALLSEPLSGKPYAELLRGVGDTLHILMLSELAALGMALMMLVPVLGTGGAP